MLRLFKKLLFLFVASLQITALMAQQAPDPQIDQAAIDRAVARAEEVVERMPRILGRVPEILRRVEVEDRRRKADDAARKREAYQNQNTILFATQPRDYEYRIPVGEWAMRYDNQANRYIPDDGVRQARIPRFAFFKRDIISGITYLANFIADIGMYKFINKSRVQRIKDYMLEHHQEVENLLLHIKNESLKLDYQVEDKVVTQAQAAEGKKKLLGLLKKFVETEHALHNVFMNTELIAIIVGRLALERVSSAVERAFISNRAPVDIMGAQMEMPLPPSCQGSFEFDEHGQRVQCQDYPISMLSALRTVNGILFCPQDLSRIFWADVSDMAEDGLKWANAILHLGIPKFVFHPKFKMAAKFGLDITSLVLAIKIFDTQSHQGWITYLEKNYEELLTIMQEYKALKKSAAPEDLKKLKSVENKLEKFIEEGHKSPFWKPGSELASWFKSKTAGMSTVNLYQNLAIFGLVAVKAFQLYRYITAPAPAPVPDPAAA